ncbi:hypothetical protein ES703_103553 [subsurface metagenome]
MVVYRQTCKPFGAEFACKQAPLYRAVCNNADIVLSAVVQQFIFNLAMEHAVRRLKRGDGVDLLHAFDLLDVKIRYAEVSELAFVRQFGHFFPGLLDVFVRLGPMHLIKVNHFYAKSFQACVTFFPDALPFQAVYFFFFFVPQQSALCCNQRFLTCLL